VTRITIRSVFVAVLILAFALVGQAQIKVTVDHNTGAAATPAFKFEHVSSPTRDNAASKAKVWLIVGEKDGNSADVTALNDGILPSEVDQPAANFYFDAGTDGGRFLFDLGSAMTIAWVNSYSWHPGSRGPQVYNLFVSDGSDPNFNPKPDAHTDPSKCGWKLVATVDTRPEKGDGGGQYGVSIADASGSIGKLRYLLFDSIPTETEDTFGNTFFSEINIVEKKN
jgi:hypothetical protein